MTDRTEILQAIKVLRDYLQSEFICDTCHEEPMFGCVSCQAITLDRQLLMLADAAGHDAKRAQTLSDLAAFDAEEGLL